MGLDLGTSRLSPLRIHEVSRTEFIPDAPQDFLKQLARPTLLIVPGQDARRVRVLTTLLHANEPSGFFALHRWLRTGPRPTVTVATLVAQVDAALKRPGFAWRALPGQPDLNRRFEEPFEGRAGQLAQAILDALSALKPEALVDIHNTSSRGPGYVVATQDTLEHKALTSLFCEVLVVTHLRMGTLINATEELCPSIVVEAGGARDPAATDLAYQGLSAFVSEPNVLDRADDNALRVFHHPVRVLLRSGCSVHYSDEPIDGASLTLRTNVHELNYGLSPEQTELGWVGQDGLSSIVARDDDGVDRVADLFQVVNGRLRTRRPIQFFMVTTHPEIAQQDCLFYAVSSN